MRDMVLYRLLRMFLVLFLYMVHCYYLEYLHKMDLKLTKSTLYIHIKIVNPQFLCIVQARTSWNQFGQGSILHQNILIQPFCKYCSKYIVHRMQKGNKTKQWLVWLKKDSMNRRTLNKVKKVFMNQNYRYQVFTQNNQSNQSTLSCIK